MKYDAIGSVDEDRDRIERFVVYELYKQGVDEKKKRSILGVWSMSSLARVKLVFSSHG